jgi:hypothetical protein
VFARLTVYDDVDLSVADAVRAFLEAQDADPFGELPGYRGSMTLVDRDNARLVGIGFYASAGQAEEADALVGAMYERVRDEVPADVRQALDWKPDSVGVFEIVHRD